MLYVVFQLQIWENWPWYVQKQWLSRRTTAGEQYATQTGDHYRYRRDSNRDRCDEQHFSKFRYRKL